MSHASNAPSLLPFTFAVAEPPSQPPLPGCNFSLSEFKQRAAAVGALLRLRTAAEDPVAEPPSVMRRRIHAPVVACEPNDVLKHHPVPSVTELFSEDHAEEIRPVKKRRIDHRALPHTTQSFQQPIKLRLKHLCANLIQPGDLSLLHQTDAGGGEDDKTNFRSICQSDTQPQFHVNSPLQPAQTKSTPDATIVAAERAAFLGRVFQKVDCGKRGFLQCRLCSQICWAPNGRYHIETCPTILAERRKNTMGAGEVGERVVAGVKLMPEWAFLGSALVRPREGKIHGFVIDEIEDLEEKQENDLEQVRGGIERAQSTNAEQRDQGIGRAGKTPVQGREAESIMSGSIRRGERKGRKGYVTCVKCRAQVWAPNSTRHRRGCRIQGATGVNPGFSASAAKVSQVPRTRSRARVQKPAEELIDIPRNCFATPRHFLDVSGHGSGKQGHNYRQAVGPTNRILDNLFSRKHCDDQDAEGLDIALLACTESLSGS